MPVASKYVSEVFMKSPAVKPVGPAVVWSVNDLSKPLSARGAQEPWLTPRTRNAATPSNARLFSASGESLSGRRGKEPSQVTPRNGNSTTPSSARLSSASMSTVMPRSPNSVASSFTPMLETPPRRGKDSLSSPPDTIPECSPSSTSVSWIYSPPRVTPIQSAAPAVPRLRLGADQNDMELHGKVDALKDMCEILLAKVCLAELFLSRGTYFKVSALGSSLLPGSHGAFDKVS